MSLNLSRAFETTQVEAAHQGCNCQKYRRVIEERLDLSPFSCQISNLSTVVAITLG
jgi:hypothetical protein